MRIQNIHNPDLFMTIRSRDYLEYKRNGWKDVTPQPSRKQVDQRHRWIDRGKVELARANVAAVIRSEQVKKLDTTDLHYLMLAEGVLKRLCKQV